MEAYDIYDETSTLAPLDDSAKIPSCPRCGQSGYTYTRGDLVEWCKVCDVGDLKAKFGEWTSGHREIDELIQHTQLNAIVCDHYLEWVDPKELSNEKHLAEGGFGSVFTATWSRGIRRYAYSTEEELYKIGRTPPCTVALKILHTSGEPTSEFLNEVKSSFKLQNSVYGIARVQGITRHPQTDKFAFVMEYYRKGSLHSTLKGRSNNIAWFRRRGTEDDQSDGAYRFDRLYTMAWGLYEIHATYLVHGDLHSGNVLVDDFASGTDALGICDFGLCKCIRDYGTDQKNGTYGVVPYMAPELFQGQACTQTSDMYAAGILMWELSSDEPAFSGCPHNMELILDIYKKGLRPEVVPGTPQCWVDLMQRCWNHDPAKRPTARELLETILDWRAILYSSQDDPDGVKKQFEEAQSYLESHSAPAKSTSHPDAIYTSRFVPYISDELVMPVTPTSPTSPVTPITPMSPMSPISPISPISPMTPRTSRTPRAPTTPAAHRLPFKIATLPPKRRPKPRSSLPQLPPIAPMSPMALSFLQMPFDLQSENTHVKPQSKV